MPQRNFRSPGNPVFSDEEIVKELSKDPTQSIDQIRDAFKCSPRRASSLRDRAKGLHDEILRFKKTGKIDWREHFKIAGQTQGLKNKASWSQDHAVIDVQERYKIKTPIVIQQIADTHIGSLATNYEALEEITDGLLATPNLFWILNGDLTETTVIFKNALAVHSQLMDIETQHGVLENWLDTIAPKVISAGWDNHGVEREEKHGAFSHIKQLLNRRFVYHNGMGRIDIVHGEATYKLLVSHNIRGYSIFNQLHGAKRLMRLQFPSVDICFTADKHTPDIEQYYDGEMKRAALMGGSFSTENGYSKRYFSLYTKMDMPAIVLFPDSKYFSVHMNAQEALAIANGMKLPPKF